MLDYDHEYYVTIDKGVIEGFDGIKGKKGWTFKTKAKAPDASQRVITVSADGKGDFSTVQGAMDFIPDSVASEQDRYTVKIKNGEYEELVYFRNKRFVTIEGESREGVLVHYPNNEVFNPHPADIKTNEVRGTFPSRRAAFAADNCSDLVIRNLTLRTDCQGQAEGLLVNGERNYFENVHVIGSGDALQANGSCYWQNCRIDGGGDTVLGRGPSFFNHCTLTSYGAFMWIRNTEENHGNVFVDCHFKGLSEYAEIGRLPDNKGKNYPYAECVLLNCTLESIPAAGWGRIDETAKTATILEFNSHDIEGNLVDVSKRHPLMRQLDPLRDAELIGKYSDSRWVLGWKPDGQKPRLLISTDIGGTDPDDNQSMVHLMMYSDLFQLEGLISSPSFGSGSKEEILRMISLYEQDYPKLRASNPGLMSPDAMRQLVKQGRRGLMPYKGYAEPSEGSEWIVRQARKESSQPLWVLVWGTLEDVAQALHDAPDIESRIRVYWIGGPNKKWGANSYAYIAKHHPNLWMIENNATYRGFITDNDKMELIEEYRGMEADEDRYGTGYYDYAMKGAGVMGTDFINYYKGIVKMGDTPSLLYMMNGDPNDPEGESWGGSFEPIRHSSRRVFHHETSVQDTIPVYSIVEWHFRGPVRDDISQDSACLTATIDKQKWAGYYLGDGDYVLRYCPKMPARLTYSIVSPIAELDGLSGAFVVDDVWPGKSCADDYPLGIHWYSDRSDRSLYEDKWQGAKTQRKWRTEILEDWAKRWRWLR